MLVVTLTGHWAGEGGGGTPQFFGKGRGTA